MKKAFSVLVVGIVSVLIAGAAFDQGEKQEKSVFSGAEKKAEELFYKLKYGDLDAKFAAASELAKIGKPAVLFLIQALKDEDENVRGYAVMALGKIKDRKTIPHLKKVWKEDKSKAIQTFAASALVKIGNNEDAYQFLVAALKDEDEFVRSYAAVELKKIQGVKFTKGTGIGFSESEKLKPAYLVDNLRVWLDAEVVSNGSADNIRPTLALDSNENIHIVYERAKSRKAIYKKRIGDNWTSAEIFLEDAQMGFLEMVIDSNNSIHTTWSNAANIRYRKKSGCGWEPIEIVSGNLCRNHGSHIAVSDIGNVSITWHSYIGPHYSDAYYNQKTSDGWSRVEFVSTKAHEVYWPTVAVDSTGNAHVVWNDANAPYPHHTYSEVEYTMQSLNGSWSPVEVVSTEFKFSDKAIPTVFIDNSDNAHVVWRDNGDYNGAGTDYDIFYKMKGPDGWTTTEVVSTESTGSVMQSGYSRGPGLVVGSSGNVYFAWEDNTDYRSAGTDYDIFYKIKKKEGME